MKINRIGYKFLKNEFDNLNINYIQSITNFITLIFKDDKISRECSQFLLEEGVIVRNLSSFGLPKCIRVTIGTPHENMIFVDKIKKFIKAS